jgi:hypothetical protein
MAMIRLDNEIKVRERRKAETRSCIGFCRKVEQPQKQSFNNIKHDSVGSDKQ